MDKKISHRIIRFAGVAALVISLSSCFDTVNSETYTLLASFEYGSSLKLRADSTYYAAEGFGIGYNYLVFCHNVDPDTKEFRGGFRISALEGQIRPVEDEADEQTKASDVVAPLDMTWRAHSIPGKNTYMVYSMSQDRPTDDVEFLMAKSGTCTMQSCMVTNTTKVAEEIAGKFERGDKLVLKAIGYKDGKQTGTAEIALADYTQNDKTGQPKDSIVSRWTTFDLSALQTVDKVRFELESGKSVQKYFCLDSMIASIAIEY